jgi:hypothetical protein
MTDLTRPSVTAGSIDEIIPNSEEEMDETEAPDDPDDPSVTFTEPRCRRCGQRFSTDAELVEHAQNCKGGTDQGGRPHFH